MTNKKKILIAEDDKPMSRAMELKLSKAGFQVKVVFNGEEALQLLEGENFDLIISDLMMPKLDGFGILAALKEKDIKTPIIITSNLSQSEDEKKAKEMGARDYFVKSNTPIIKIVDYVKKILK